MKSEEKGSSFKVRIAVLGMENVGKSAVTVRYLTRRYIGEYRSNTVHFSCTHYRDRKKRRQHVGEETLRMLFQYKTKHGSTIVLRFSGEDIADLLYRQMMSINNSTVEVEIVDVCSHTSSKFPEEPVHWADACVVVYDITSSSSLKYAEELLQQLQKIRTQHQLSLALLGNKADLEHLRQTEETEGRAIALQHNCHFHEISVAENSSAIYQTFDTLLNECRSLQKTRKFSVSKMIGTLMGSTNNDKLPHNVNHGGTVVVCQKSDLYKARLLKRRQNFMSTSSL